MAGTREIGVAVTAVTEAIPSRTCAVMGVAVGVTLGREATLPDLTDSLLLEVARARTEVRLVLLGPTGTKETLGMLTSSGSRANRVQVLTARSVEDPTFATATGTGPRAIGMKAGVTTTMTRRGRGQTRVSVEWAPPGLVGRHPGSFGSKSEE